jgi:uncharacterized protein (TIGR02145 family)
VEILLEIFTIFPQNKKARFFMSGTKEWSVLINGQQQGPFSMEELRSKGLPKDARLWKAGMPDWVPASDIIKEEIKEPAPQEAKVELPKEPENKGSSKSKIIILIAAVIVIAVAVAGVFVLPSVLSEKEEPPVYGFFNDARNGKSYKTVKIGPQTWMAENLNYEIKESKCYGDKPENCIKYGRLYNWPTAVKACPAGWHLPSEAEWKILADRANNANKLKSKTGWNIANGTDNYGFAALPGSGHSSLKRKFDVIGYGGYWWSSSKKGDIVYFFEINSHQTAAPPGYALTGDFFSVRCVQN